MEKYHVFVRDNVNGVRTWNKRLSGSYDEVQSYFSYLLLEGFRAMEIRLN